MSNLVDRHKYITNLSSKCLSNPHREVLALGLKFIPTGQMDKPSFLKAFGRFRRLNRLRHFFRDKPDTEPHPFRQKSNWDPPRASPVIEGYLDRVGDEIQNMDPLPYVPNLSRTHRKALRELTLDNSLVIKKADKGSGIVVEDRENYIRDGLAHLSDTNVYEQIAHDPTEKLGWAINDYVSTLHRRGIIDKITKDYLMFPPDKPPRTQQMYFLKKIHKSPTAVRPIVSGCQGATEGISKLVDMILQPFVPEVSSYIRDTGHIIGILEDHKFPKGCTLASIDVRSMYTNISSVSPQ